MVVRPGLGPYVTDFIACVKCKVMYFEPKPPEKLSHEELMLEVYAAARQYLKPGRRPKSR
jgi:hypothetical protein